ncbi:NAD(P)/FAD-dependent oxidoreductase [Desulforamulus aquiferis]|uniref:FAD-dependent oxidoreductase n=1 Tax=Desulforamulus aquiferis TaxID=1397668 RepID=A0AAW7ZB46_9FIRM|nr:FAD-dependent oxidoreductase [Desulforamulus aquiferis]MDO7786612.1 FAD-dependent oxidoreductase [Desulforamulus aquiferis]RYD05815.1 thioredoxin reductase [Desulforamulus aquiferis]
MAQYDVAIIGAGPAGMTAAIYAARANLKVLLLDKLAPGGQIVNTFEIQNYTGMGTINGAELAIKMFEHTLELGVNFDYGTVTSIRAEGNLKELICEEGLSFTAKAVIIATGTKPRMLGVPGEINFAGTSISWCAICDGPHYRGKKVIVIGGGNSAVEEAIYLAGLAQEVTVVTLFNLTADPSACDKLKALANVRVYEYYDILEFLGSDKFEGLKARSTKTPGEITIFADGAFEYIGLKPTAEAFKELGILNDYGYIETDAYMATSVPGIYGAGDIISKHLRQVITACSDGAIAAQSVAKYIEKLN